MIDRYVRRLERNARKKAQQLTKKLAVTKPKQHPAQPTQPIVVGSDGAIRFKPNPLVVAMLEYVIRASGNMPGVVMGNRNGRREIVSIDLLAVLRAIDGTNVMHGRMNPAALPISSTSDDYEQFLQLLGFDTFKFSLQPGVRTTTRELVEELIQNPTVHAEREAERWMQRVNELKDEPPTPLSKERYEALQNNLPTTILFKRAPQPTLIGCQRCEGTGAVLVPGRFLHVASTDSTKCAQVPCEACPHGDAAVFEDAYTGKTMTGAELRASKNRVKLWEL